MTTFTLTLPMQLDRLSQNYRVEYVDDSGSTSAYMKRVEIVEVLDSDGAIPGISSLLALILGMN